MPKTSRRNQPWCIRQEGVQSCEVFKDEPPRPSRWNAVLERPTPMGDEGASPTYASTPTFASMDDECQDPPSNHHTTKNGWERSRFDDGRYPDGLRKDLDHSVTSEPNGVETGGPTDERDGCRESWTEGLESALPEMKACMGSIRCRFTSYSSSHASAKPIRSGGSFLS